MINNRKLGIVEQAMEILNRRARSWDIVTISRIKGPLSQEIVSKALNLVQCRHPRLNSRIVGPLHSLRFETEGTPKIPLRVVEVHNTQWQEVVQEELNETIDASIGLLRAVLVHSKSENSVSYLITTVHHTVSDALSCVRLHSEILTYCNRILSSDPMLSVASLPALPPLESLLPEWTQGFKGAMNNVFFALRQWFQFFWNRPETLGFEKYAPIASRRCGMIHRQLDEDLTQQLVSLCRKEKTTVQGALCAAMMFAAAKRITAGERKDVRVSCQTFLDLRRRLEPAISDEHVGIVTSNVRRVHTIRTNTSFWELAREVKQQLEAGIKHSGIFSVVLMSKHITNFCLAHPNEVLATVFISNIGKVNIPKVYGSFELEEISFVSSNCLFGGVFITAVSTFQGKMLLNFPFSEPSISRDTMESLVNSVVSCIVEVCTEKVAFTPIRSS